MDYLPLFHSLRGRPALVVGGGEAAAAKIRLLRRAGAGLRVVAPKVGPDIAGAAAEGALVWERRNFVRADVVGSVLAIAATGKPGVDQAVSRAARDAGIPVNVVDRPDLSDVIVPAIVDRGAVVVAVSTAGASPVLARRIRERIEALLPAGIGRLARFTESFRGAVRARIGDFAARRLLWEEVIDGPIGRAVLAGDEPAAREAMLGRINRHAGVIPAGRVAIVGAGPGDPDLLTLRALRALQDADVIVHDRLVGPEVLDLARRDAERVYVGKANGCHAATQDEINALLVEHAAAGRRVVRLKGGDPFVFGRGGEEQDVLRAHGIPVEIVPGITAATGCAASAGLPLTHRDHASAVTFLTAHGKDGLAEHDWASLARGRQTLVVYMGISRAGPLAARLIAHGMDRATPVAVIENGTLSDERVVIGTLGTLSGLVREHAVAGPATIVIGSVAALADAAPRTAAVPAATPMVATPVAATTAG